MQSEVDREAALDAVFARSAVLLTDAEQLPAGPGLAAALVRLQGCQFDCAGSVRLTVLWDRLVGWASAQAMVPVAAAVSAARMIPGAELVGAVRLVGDELAAASHVSVGSAMNRVGLVEQVGRALPASWEALDRGQISLVHLRALAQVIVGCPARVAQSVEARVIPAAVAGGWTPYELTRAANRIVLQVDPDGAAERAEAAKANGDVSFYPAPDETASLVATGDAFPLRRIMDAIDETAAQLGRDGDNRSVGLRRLAAMHTLILGQPTARPVVDGVVTAEITTVLGFTDHPGELAGYGPISAATTRELLKDATLRRLLTDPVTGQLTDLGETRYRPSKALQRLIEARDRTCRFPGCHQRAIRCDKDHRINWPQGPTTTSNLHCLCRRHHNLKTAKLWTVDINPDSSETWTSALGFTYLKPAAHYHINTLDPPDDIELPECNLHALQEADPDPPFPDQPPPPPLTDAEQEALDDAIDTQIWNHHAEQTYDQWRNLGLVS